MAQYQDIEEVRELYNRYALSWDEDRVEDLAQCFTPDAIFESQRGRFAGREAILHNMANVKRALGGASQRHLTTNVTMDLRGGGGAAARTSSIALAARVNSKYSRLASTRMNCARSAAAGFSARKGIVEGQNTY